MAYIPDFATWYLADSVEAITVSGDRRVVVYINTILIRAGSSEEAHQRALKLGDSNQRYRNQAGKTVTVKFLGLRACWECHS